LEAKINFLKLVNYFQDQAPTTFNPAFLSKKEGIDLEKKKELRVTQETSLGQDNTLCPQLVQRLKLQNMVIRQFHL
jgi:hypothetical protein